MTLLVTLLSPLLLGYLLVRTFTPAMKPGWAGVLLAASLGAGCGIGILSLLYFLLLTTFGPSTAAYWICEALLLGSAVAACKFLPNPMVSGQDHPLRIWGWMLASGLVLAIGIHAARFLATSAAAPHGDWDAWAIWNLRAKFLAQPDGAWRGAFSPLLGNLPGGSGTHFDYPLLLSGYIGRSWALSGSIGDTTVPISVAALFWAATVGLLVAGLAVLRSWVVGMIGGLLLLANVSFALHAPTQYADIPLAFYFLATFVLLLCAETDPRAVTLAGFTAGCAAWTKDEGVLFTCIVGLTVLFRLRRRQLMLFAAGAAVPLCALLYFKLLLVPTGGSWEKLTFTGALEQIGQPARYRQILAAFWTEAKAMGTGITHPAVGIAVILGVAGISWKRLGSSLPLFASLAAMLLGYFAVYVVTPFDLTWHLYTSASRLLTQLVPAAIFLLLSVCQTGNIAPPTAKSVGQPKKRLRG